MQKVVEKFEIMRRAKKLCLVDQIVNVLNFPNLLHGTLFTLANTPQKIKSINSLRVPVAPLEIERVAANNLGLLDIQIGANDLMRLQNAERICRLGRGVPRLRARGARALPAQKFERVAANVAIVPLDL